ncbi:unnamed protein product [Rotaria sp. Silwood2]|nr:unnamed protein product [Rotaria sp. Silwood2]CAF2955190.1 unnamed protein product [Rotaria sp. Silwood2]CAF3916017.1 unnamed protein product [Rotaria sp. Silwood2]CAF3956138.1 unnamed protein product [Rotaria sp. Silwood2]
MVRLSRGVQCTRIVLLVLNIIFLIFGFSILILGIYIKVNGNFSAITAAYNRTQTLGEESMQWIGTIMIIVGVFTSCLALFGCLGAMCQNRFFLYSYAIILGLIISLKLAIVIVVLRFRNDLWQSYDSGFEEIFQNAYRYNQIEMIKIIEQLEQEFKCCGVNSYTDYTKYGYSIPHSCYRNQIPKEFPFSQCCAEAVVLWVWNKLPFIAVVLSIILFIEIFGLISSIVLGVAISHASNTNIYKKF